MAMTPLYMSFGFADAVSDKQAELNNVQAQMQEMQSSRKEQARQKADAA